MPDSSTIFRDGDDVHVLRIVHRDWTLLRGPGFVEGAAFVSTLGIFENFTIAGGIPKGSLVHRDGKTLFDASVNLLAAIQRDLEMLQYDYSYQISNERKQFGGAQGISVDGRPGILSLRPKGYCSIRFLDGKPPEIIDLRSRDGFETDIGRIKLYRRKNETQWLDILPSLLDFLGKRLTKMMSLEHID